MSDDSTARHKGDAEARHRVLRVFGYLVLTLSVAVGLFAVYSYRHFNENLTILDVTAQLGGDRPQKEQVEGPREPINVLVMGSDSRDGKGNNIDGLKGSSQRSDTTILLHLAADRKSAHGHVHPARPDDGNPQLPHQADGKPTRKQFASNSTGGRPHLIRRHRLHDPHGRADDAGHSHRPPHGRRLQRLQGHGRRGARRRKLSLLKEPIDDSDGTLQAPRGAPESSTAKRRWGTYGARKSIGNGSDTDRMERQQAIPRRTGEQGAERKGVSSGSTRPGSIRCWTRPPSR